MGATITEYPKGFTPLVITSYRRIMVNWVPYKRRLRISRYNLLMIESILKIKFKHDNYIILKPKLAKKVCAILGVEDREIRTYLYIDSEMCSYKSGPGFG